MKTLICTATSLELMGIFPLKAAEKWNRKEELFDILIT